MNGTEFFDKLELVDAAYIQAAEEAGNAAVEKKAAPHRSRPAIRWVRLIPAAAACLCVIAAAAAFAAGGTRLPAVGDTLSGESSCSSAPSDDAASGDTVPDEKETMDDGSESVSSLPQASAETGGESAANGSTGDDAAAQSRVDIPTTEPSAFYFRYNEAAALSSSPVKQDICRGLTFTEELTAAQLRAVVPDRHLSWMSWSGTAEYNGDGTLWRVQLSTPSTLPGREISLTIGAAVGLCFALPDQPLTSAVGGQEFILGRWEGGGVVLLEARAQIGGSHFTFFMEADAEDEPQARADFEEILHCAASYPEGRPDLSGLVPTVIPELILRLLTFQEARRDPDFGSLFLRILPDGFTEESILRLKNQSTDMLSGLWTRGYAELSWKVSRYTAADAARLVHPSEREKYDLSLYPIPRAETVPEHLQTVVDDPIFDLAELTDDAVQARCWEVYDRGDDGGMVRLNFTVRLGELLISVRAKGVDPKWIYDQLLGMMDG